MRDEDSHPKTAPAPVQGDWELGSKLGKSPNSKSYETRQDIRDLTTEQFLPFRIQASAAMPFFLNSSRALVVFSIDAMPIPANTCGAFVNWQSS